MVPAVGRNRVFFCATITLGGFWRSSRNGYKDCTSDGPTIAVNTVAGLAADLHPLTPDPLRRS
jgi:hypothetical protein